MTFETNGKSNLLEVMEKKQQGWFGHLVRVKSAKQIWDAKITEKRRRERPANTWIDAIRTRENISCTDAKQLARDKRKWKKIAII